MAKTSAKDVSAEGKKRRGPKAKDPAAPKHPLTAFQLYCNAKRPELKAASPEIGFPEMGKALGKMWKEVSDAEKQPYLDQAVKDKEAYSVAKAAYAPIAAAAAAAAAANGEAGPTAKPAKGKALSPMQIFVAERELATRATMADPSDLAALAGLLLAAYQALSDDEKEALVAKSKTTGALVGGVRKGRKLSEAGRARALKKHAELLAKREKTAEKLGEIDAQLAAVCADLGIARCARQSTRRAAVAWLRRPAATQPPLQPEFAGLCARTRTCSSPRARAGWLCGLAARWRC